MGKILKAMSRTGYEMKNGGVFRAPGHIPASLQGGEVNHIKVNINSY